MAHDPCLMIATGTAKFAIAMQCSHVMSHFMIASFNDGHSDPKCQCNSRTICMYGNFQNLSASELSHLGRIWKILC